MTQTVTAVDGISVNGRVKWRIAGTYDKGRRDWEYGHGTVLRIFRHHPGEGLAAMVQPDGAEDAQAFHLGSLEKDADTTQAAGEQQQ